MANTVYINKISKFLPGQPIDNDGMEQYLGLINGEKSKAKSIVLRNNGIKTRYYALDNNGKSTYTNAQLAAEAIINLGDNHFSINDIQLLACGTTSPDQLLPSHASMVHGLLKIKPVEYTSTSGSCNAGMLAMKYAFLSVKSGNTQNAVCSGSEKLSTWLQAKNFEEEISVAEKLENKPILAFEKEFLRWMLSDGAAAALITDKQNENSLSLKIHWIEIISFAGSFDTCMYAGAEKSEDGNLIPWRDFSDKEMSEKSILTLKQDTRLLVENIIKTGGQYLETVCEKHNFDINEISWFVPHLSSLYFQQKIADELKLRKLYIPEEKWFINLPRVGNVGSASVYLMLEELFNSNRLEKGDKILAMIPESARFSYSYALFETV
jgi:3-oxoacyl-[acyl-carrier-protein] synthase-3